MSQINEIDWDKVMSLILRERNLPIETLIAPLSVEFSTSLEASLEYVEGYNLELGEIREDECIYKLFPLRKDSVIAFIDSKFGVRALTFITNNNQVFREIKKLILKLNNHIQVS